MPDNNELQIVLSLDDKASAQAKQALNGIGDSAKKAASEAGESLEKMGSSLQSVGREIGHVSTTLAFLGGGIVAPFAIALNNASKSSILVSNEMERLTAVTNKFQSDLAQAVLPAFHQFTNEMNGLLKSFEAMPEPLRNAAAQTVFFTGTILVATAAVGFFTKEILILWANLLKLAGGFTTFVVALWASNPVLVIITAAVLTLISVLLIFNGLTDRIINSFEIMFRFLLIGLGTVGLAFIGMVQAVLKGLEWMLEGLSKIKSPWQKNFKDMEDGIKGLSQTVQGFANKDMGMMGSQLEKITLIYKTGSGEWSKAWDNVRTSAINYFTAAKKGNDQIVVDTSSAQKELITLANQLRDINIQNTNNAFMNEKRNINESIQLAKFYQANWMQAHAGVKDFAVQAATAVKTNLTNAISGIITGATTAKEAFQQLGQAMIKMVVDYFVQKAISMALDFAFGKAAIAASVATQVAAATAITAAFAPAALAANIASFGGAAIAAAATFPIAATAEVAAMAASTGAGVAHLAEGTDTVPAMLSPGEMVFPRSMADAIRSGDISVSGGGGAGGGNGDITINLNGITINSKENIRQLAEELGFEIKRKLRGARSNL